MVIEIDFRFKFSSAGSPPKNDVGGAHECSLIKAALRVALAKGIMMLPQLVESIATLFGG
jgi:hypothetical protein